MKLAYQRLSEPQGEKDEHLIALIRLLLKCGEQVSTNDGTQLRHAE